MAEQVCIDANLLVRNFTREEGWERVAALLIGIGDAGTEIVAPAFMAAEVGSSLRLKVHRGLLTQEEGEEAMRASLDLDVKEVSGPKLYLRAWELAALLGTATIYDTVYLAVAEDHQAEFWTGDEKLHRLVQSNPDLARRVKLL